MSDFQADLIDGYERIEFMLRESLKLSKSDQARTQKTYFFCRKCDLLFISFGPDDLCPGCKTVQYIELIWR